MPELADPASTEGRISSEELERQSLPLRVGFTPLDSAGTDSHMTGDNIGSVNVAVHPSGDASTALQALVEQTIAALEGQADALRQAMRSTHLAAGPPSGDASTALQALEQVIVRGGPADALRQAMRYTHPAAGLSRASGSSDHQPAMQPQGTIQGDPTSHSSDIETTIQYGSLQASTDGDSSQIPTIAPTVLPAAGFPGPDPAVVTVTPTNEAPALIFCLWKLGHPWTPDALCGAALSSKPAAIAKHLVEVHGIPKQQMVFLNTPVVVQVSRSCGWMGCKDAHLKNDWLADSLARHIRIVHLQFGEVVCPYCSMKLSRPDALKRHVSNKHKILLGAASTF